MFFFPLFFLYSFSSLFFLLEFVCLKNMDHEHQRKCIIFFAIQLKGHKTSSSPFIAHLGHSFPIKNWWSTISIGICLRLYVCVLCHLLGVTRVKLWKKARPRTLWWYYSSGITNENEENCKWHDKDKNTR